MCSSVSTELPVRQPELGHEVADTGHHPWSERQAGLLGPRLVHNSLPRLVDRAPDLGMAVDAHGARQNRYGS